MLEAGQNTATVMRVWPSIEAEAATAASNSWVSRPPPPYGTRPSSGSSAKAFASTERFPARSGGLRTDSALKQRAHPPIEQKARPSPPWTSTRLLLLRPSLRAIRHRRRMHARTYARPQRGQGETVDGVDDNDDINQSPLSDRIIPQVYLYVHHTSKSIDMIPAVLSILFELKRP